MPLKPSDEISTRIAHIAELRPRVAELHTRADAGANAALKAELRGQAAHWTAILESYQRVDGADRFLGEIRSGRSKPLQVRPWTARC